MRYIILLLMFIGPCCQAKVVADSMLMNGFINVDYFPDKWQKEPQYNISAPTVELNAENYISHHQLQWLTLGLRGYSLWSKKEGQPVEWEKMRLQSTLYTQILPYTHIGYSVKFVSDKPDEADVNDKSQWVHGMSLRISW